jgi:ABC-type transport system substrate-binding protein
VGDQKIDDWVAQLNNELDADKRAAIGRQAADYLDQQLYGLPMILVSSLVAVGPNVQSFGFVKANPYAGPTSWIIAK